MKTFLFSLLLSVAAFAIEPLVDTTWLQHHIGDKKLRIVEVSTPKSYTSGHIKDALHTTIDKWRVNHGTFITIRSAQEIQKEIRRLGIDASTEVVLYADIQTPKDFLKASYIFWALNYHGITNVAFLDGGKQAWIEEGAALESTIPAIAASSYKVKIQPALIADRTYVEEHIGKLPMLDARPSDKYLGIAPTATVARDGHIKGAMSYSWNYSVESDYTLKESKKLETLFKEGYKLDKESEVIVYCTGGLETSFNYFVLSGVLGYKHVRLYDASMKEWGNRRDTPMVQYTYEVFKK
ncbi:sulfurtransferase [Sulfurovum sp. TSL1]|uniref:sulfurtransferase n=1 Tax=Sulfurovum sp. TSL1 TaxID=2826994 RepID=UPI001CC537F2|nr:rhodanese-like domain-containing protein [Sulfurovum sp. TSL1]GIT98943.1 sulfurtransferase [Sulfurovum sp. TSL1]